MIAGRRNTVDWAPLALVGVLVYLVLVPVAFLVVSSFKPDGFPTDPGWTLTNFGKAYGDPGFPRLLVTTLAFVAGSTALAVGLGGGLALLIERTDVYGRRLLRWLVLLPMAAPPLLMGAAWSLLLSPRGGAINQVLMSVFGLDTAPFDIHGLWGMVFVEGLVLVPTAYLMLMPPTRALDPTLEEAALASGAPIPTVFMRITIPLLLPAVLATASFIAIAGFVVFDVPGVIGIPGRVYVFSSQLFLLMTESPTGLPQYGVISALSVFFLVVLCLLAFAYRQMTRQAERFAVVSGRSGARRLIPLGKRRRALSVLPWGYVAIAGASPVLMLLWTSLLPFASVPSWSSFSSLTLTNHVGLFRDPVVVTGVVNTLTVALASATLVALLSGAAAWFGVNRSGRLGRLIEGLSFAPVAVPGVILGVALLYMYMSFSLIPIYGTVGILVVAYVTMYLAYGSRSMGSVVVQLHGDMQEAAANCGAGGLLTMRRILVPLALPGLVAVWAWVFIHAVRELSAALMLRGPENVVLTTLLWDYWSGGRSTAAAALGVWLILGMAAVIGVWRMRVSR